jgi:hypothetical protein
VPTIFQARCENCDFASAVFPAEYGAVFVDQPQANNSGTVVAGAVLHGDAKNAEIAEQADPRLIVLAHPIEFEILAESGYTWTTLAWAGRYVRVRRVVCRDCGTLFEIPQLTFPPAVGCEVGCISGLVIGVAVGIWRRSLVVGFGAAYTAVLGCVVLLSVAGIVYTRVRFRRRARELRGSACCPRCRSGRYAGAESRRVFPCPKCSQPAMRVRRVGIS